MGYLILQILVCLLVAALIGTFIGWWLRSWHADKQVASVQSSWQTRLSELQVQLTEKNAALSTANSNLHDRDAKIRSLDQELLTKTKALEDLRTKYDELTVKLSDSELNLKEQRTKVSSLETRAETLRQDLNVKDAQLKTLHSRIGELERQLKECDSARKNLETKHQATTDDKDNEIAKPGNYVNELAHVPGQEFHEPQLHARPPADDLKKISGISPVLEKTLNRLGYYRFRDIATWSDTEIETVAKALNTLPSRIRRDKWVAQAESLHRKKYGNAP